MYSMNQQCMVSLYVEIVQLVSDKITRLVFVTGRSMGFLYGIVVQCRTNITWQLIGAQRQRCQCRESSNLTGNRTCRRVQNCSTVSRWLVVLWDFCMEFWYNVIQILPDRELDRRSSSVSSVRAPISVGIFPTKMTRLVWGDDSFNGIIVWDSGTMSF